jgi:hypothetical protein
MAEKVELTFGELAAGSEIGRLRQILSLRAGRKTTHNFQGDAWQVHIEGALGELAACKALGINWPASIDQFSGPDLPFQIQVRTRPNHDYELYLWPGESVYFRWVLVTGKAPVYFVRGWETGPNLNRCEYLRAVKPGRPQSFFYPTDLLKPLESLKHLISTERVSDETTGFAIG